jgi:MYXO-CTERM domain-containing protein
MRLAPLVGVLTVGLASLLQPAHAAVVLVGSAAYSLDLDFAAAISSGATNFDVSFGLSQIDQGDSVAVSGFSEPGLVGPVGPLTLTYDTPPVPDTDVYTIGFNLTVPPFSDGDGSVSVAAVVGSVTLDTITLSDVDRAVSRVSQVVQPGTVPLPSSIALLGLGGLGLLGAARARRRA